MNVRIFVISHDQQRYNTVGDWYFEGEDLVIRVSKMENWRSEMLVALHKLVEVLLCKNDGVSQESADKFDTSHIESDEPGDEIDAPYRDQHCFAMAVERMVCAAMKMPWKEHDATVMKI